MAVSSPLEARRPLGRQERHLVDAYRTRILAAFPGQVERIVLFGSRARSEVHGVSDWDFAVFFKDEISDSARDALWEIDRQLGQRFGCEIQSLDLTSDAWLAESELACNIRDHGLIIHGDDDVPRLERPVLQHARDALVKAERFAELSAGTPDDRFEGVIHGAYYAMFHGARAALLAVEGSASTKHGRVVDAFTGLVKRRFRFEAAGHAAALIRAYRHRIKADYGNEDLTATGRRLRARVAPFLAFCRQLVDRQAAPGAVDPRG